MSDIRVVDQFGNFPKPPCDRLSVQLIPDDWPHGTGPQDDRFTDDLGKTSFPGATQLWPASGYTLRVNHVNVNPKYGEASVHVTATGLEAGPITLTVQKQPDDGGGGGGGGGGNALSTITCQGSSGIQGYGTTQEWKPIAHQLAPAGIMEPQGGPQPNLRAFDAALRAVPVPAGFEPCQLQFSLGGGLKPRIHLPTKGTTQDGGPCGKYSRVVDIGDFAKPFFHDSTSTDVWQLTGRPASSQW